MIKEMSLIWLLKSTWKANGTLGRKTLFMVASTTMNYSLEIDLQTFFWLVHLPKFWPAPHPNPFSISVTSISYSYVQLIFKPKYHSLSESTRNTSWVWMCKRGCSCPLCEYSLAGLLCLALHVWWIDFKSVPDHMSEQISVTTVVILHHPAGDCSVLKMNFICILMGHNDVGWNCESQKHLKNGFCKYSIQQMGSN